MVEKVGPVTLVMRPRPLPWKLRRLARESGKDPRATVVAVLTTAWSFEAAAVELGITPKTLRHWRRILGIEVLIDDHAQRAGDLRALPGNGRARAAGADRAGSERKDVGSRALHGMRGNGAVSRVHPAEEVPA